MGLAADGQSLQLDKESFMNSMLKLAVGALVGSLPLLAVATSAQATVAGSPQQVVVRYHDLDLNTQHGAQIMYRRLDQAARTVCGFEDPINLGTWDKIRTCQHDAVAKAVKELHRSELTSVYGAHTAARTG